MAKLPAPSGPAAPEEDTNEALTIALRGVNGKVSNTIVTKIRKMVDQDPKAFVNGMRRLLYADGPRD
jgi:hypothetical protein